MDESAFEGTVVLEELAAICRLDDFMQAVDSDNFGKAKQLMKLAGIDAETIAIVLRKMNQSDGSH